MGAGRKKPRGYYAKAEDWFEKAGVDIRDWRQEVKADTAPYALVPPKGLETPIHWRLKKTSGPVTAAAQKQGIVTTIPGGRVVGSNSEILAADGKLILEYSPHADRGPEHHPFLTGTQLPPLAAEEATIAVLSRRTSGAYYHWMLDILPCVHLLRQSGIRPDNVVINGNRLAPFQYETLKMLGISKKRIIESGDQLHLQPSRLVIPTLSEGIRPKWVYDFLRRELMEKQGIRPGKHKHRIYVSRAGAWKRRLLNEDEVMGLLGKYGFVSVELEKLSVKRQIELFASAEAVAGPHGSGFTNLLFSPPGTKVIEFFSPLYVHRFFPLLSSMAGHDHYYVIGEGERPPEGTRPPDGKPDMTVRIKDVAAILELAGLRPARRS